MKNLHNTYHEHMENKMRDENLEALKARILKASRKMRAEQEKPAAVFTKPRSRHVLRRVTACACALAVVCGAVAVSGMQNGSSTAVRPQAAKTASHTNNNWFSLAAYAAGGDAGKAPAVATVKNAAGIKSTKLYVTEQITDFGHQRVISDFAFDLKCKGKNIEQLKYEIIGKPTFVVSGNPTQRGDPRDPYEYVPKEQPLTGFTAKPGEDLKKYRIHCVAPITAVEEAILKAGKYCGQLETEEAKKYNYHSAEADAYPDLSYCHTIEEVKRNAVLDGTIIRVTAKFQDGTTQTMRYQLNVAKDYLDKEREWETAGEKLDEEESKFPQAVRKEDVKTGEIVRIGPPKSKKQLELEKKEKELDDRTLGKMYYITELK